MERYNPKKFQKEWQKKWESAKVFEVDLKNSSHPFYNLMMFPYPSGEGLHVGHVYAFGGADTYGHYMKMKGKDVFEPMGFDSFGIHSENYAIKIGKHPKELTEETTRYFREEQLKKLGALFDWKHSVSTSDANYYKWTQWLFIQLFKAGLAERKKASVEWCPSCKTVLANEQVINGKCERCGSEVIQRELEQWFFRITDYAQRLLDNLEKIDWSETTKTMQRNWIGKSLGVELDFEIKGYREKLKVFTTRIDTVYGATFMAIASEHPLVSSIELGKDANDYLAQAKGKNNIDREKDKTGVFTGLYAINPLTKKEIPIWIADYVLSSYGTGAIMAVPAHDERDFDFAKHYNLPIVEVIKGGDLSKRAWTGDGKLVNSGKFNGLTVKEAQIKLLEYIHQNQIGKKETTYHLRDWLISRQRYWGPPIPMIFCEKCSRENKSFFSTEEANRSIINKTYQDKFKREMKGWYPVPEEKLPVKLPEVKDFKPLGTGKSPLATVDDFVNVACPGCGSQAKRETDVSDTFLDSSWYFLRYSSTEFNDRPFDTELTKKWLPVDMYIGGNEHAVLHLLYTRFITMALYDLKLINFEEPFKKFRAHGLVIKDGAKMSKSRGNVVNPNDYMESYGVDALRMYLLFLGPYEQGGDFSDRAITGVYRFLNRVWNLVLEVIEMKNEKEDEEQLQKLYQLNKRIDNDLSQLKFNTAVAALMEELNSLVKNKEKLSIFLVKYYLKLLAPLAPFTSEELWQQLGEKNSIHTQTWPEAKSTVGKAGKTTIVIQVNGKLRDKVEVINPSKQAVVSLALDRDKIKVYTANKEVKQLIWVEGKLLNIVLN